MTPKRLKKSRFRILTIGIVFGVFFGIVTFRAYQLQILGNVRLQRLVESQYTTNITFRPKRGTIYDRNGDILAIDVEVATIAIHPGQIQDKNAVRAALLKHTDIKTAQLDKKLNSKRRFEFVQRRIPYEKGQAIAKNKFKGVVVEKEYRRFYPNKELAGHLLGAVGYDAKALGGIELTYDDYLRSSTKKQEASKDARGKLFFWDRSHEDTHDLHLTIDTTIQHVTEEALRDQATKHKVKKGFAIVLDAKTSEVLAMANYPEFNPNIYWKYPNHEQWKNRAILDAFEPGSTLKSLVIASALEVGKVTPNKKFFCERGAMKIGKDTIKDHDAAYEDLSVSEILKVSSNIGMTKIAFHVGREDIFEGLKKFKFAQKTKIGLSGEPAGILRPFKKWRDIEFSNISFGQGMTVNGLQMIAAYGVLANKGDYTHPILVKTISDSEGDTVFQAKPKVEKDLFSEKTINALRKMMFTVTQQGGTAPLAHLPGYKAAGKTGTAQTFDPKTRTYSKDKYISSFIGYAPLEEPEVVIYVVYETHKDNGHYGGIVAGPAFKDIARKTLTYLSVVPKEIQKDSLFKKEGYAQNK